jgi:hypothetical protein
MIKYTQCGKDCYLRAKRKVGTSLSEALISAADRTKLVIELMPISAPISI